MNPIYQALQAGYSPKKIAELLKKLDPSLAGPISLALQAGYPIKKVLNFIMNGGKNLSAQYPKAPKNIFEKAATSVHPAIPGMAKAAVTAATAIGAYGLGRYALSRAAPRAITGELLAAEEEAPLGLPYNRPELPAPGQEGFEQQAPIPEGPIPMGFQRKPLGEQNQPQIEPEIPIPGEKVAQKAEITHEIPNIDSESFLSRLGIKDNVDTMIKRGNKPDAIAGVLTQMLTSEGRKLVKDSKIPLQKIVEDYASKTPEIKQKEQQNIRPEVKEMVASQQREEMPKEQDKKLAVLSNGNLGEIESVKNGIAKINVDGNIKHRKVEDLVESPIPSKDLSDLFDDLTSGVEKETGESVSRMVAWAGYDPRVNELIFLPHDGGAYVYNDISPEDAKQLTDILSLRKTSGENFIGAWKAGSKSPIGAAMSKLIQKLQKERGGKGSEYNRKFMKIYDALEAAKEAKKKKMKKGRR